MDFFYERPFPRRPIQRRFAHPEKMPRSPTRRQDHRQPPAFHFRELLHLRETIEVAFHPLQDFGTQILVTNLAPSEPQGHLHLVSVGQKAPEVAEFGLVIRFFRPRAKLDFFDLRLCLFFLGCGSPLVLLEEELTEVHQPTNRRLGMRRDLDKVKPVFFGEFQPFGARDDPSLFSRIPDQPNGLGLDLGVDPIPFFRGDRLLLPVPK